MNNDIPLIRPECEAASKAPEGPGGSAKRWRSAGQGIAPGTQRVEFSESGRWYSGYLSTLSSSFAFTSLVDILRK